MGRRDHVQLRITRHVATGVLAALACGLPMAQPVAQERAAAASPRTNLAIVREAQELQRRGRAGDAMQRLREADRMGPKSALEQFEIEQVRADAAAELGDNATAAKSLEMMLGSPHLLPADRLPTQRKLVARLFDMRDHAGVIAWSTRYVKEGGADLQVRWLQAQSHFQLGDYANAARELQLVVQAEERSGQTPPEAQLVLLQKSYQMLGDNNAIVWAQEKLVSYYPSKSHWAELLDRVQRRPDFGDRLALDVLRLRFLTGTLRGADDYAQMATLSLQAALPAEAKRVVEQGFANGVLDAARHEKLREQVQRQAAELQQTLSRPDAEAAATAARDGIWLVNLGFANVMQGDYAKGLALMEQGMRKGGLAERPQDSKLRLGVAYLLAGQRARAIETFRNVGGTHGAADLGRIWAIYARNTAP